MTDLPKPGPREGLQGRPLHFIFIADCSGSMLDRGKIQALNQAVREALPHMKQAAMDNPQAQVLVRALRFSDSARWIVDRPTPVGEFFWTDLEADGTTMLGAALEMVARELRMPPMPERALPPVLVLLTDGEPTDDWAAGLKALMDQPWGKKAVRIGIAIGADANLSVLQKFIGPGELRPLQANNPEALVQHIKWASTQVVNSVASPASRNAGADWSLPVSITPPPTTTPGPTPQGNTPQNPGDVW
jgi:uncharacterized protein YegL